MSALLELRDVATHFETPRGVVRAVDGVDLTLHTGDFVGIVGESGSGKSVLARTILGLLPRRNVRRRGTIVFDGEERLTTWPTRRTGAGMSIVFQDPTTSINPVRTVGALLCEVLEHRSGLDRRTARNRALELLADVGLPEPQRQFGQFSHELSGGMRQRVMIALALAGDPQLLLADEPTTALDVTVQAQIMALLGRLREERSMTTILVTHDLALVAGRCDQVVVLYAGQVVETGPTTAVFRSPRMPYTEALLGSMPRIDAPPMTQLATIPGRPPVVIDPRPGCRFAPRCRYVGPRCHNETPPLVPSESPGHAYACWYPVGVPSTRARAHESQHDGTHAESTPGVVS